MNTKIESLAPAPVWKNFKSLTQIPRPSKHEARIIEFVKKFGENLGLKTTVDAVGNVVITQTCRERDGKPERRYPAIASRYGSAEEQR